MTTLIAEFCQNHNGDESILTEMIHAAAENGATYGKIQTIFSEDVTFRERFEQGETEEGRTKVIKRPFKQEVERLKKLELSYEQQRGFIEKCEKAGLRPLTTAFTRGSVTPIREIGFKSIKIASYDCGSLPLIRECQEAFDDMIISTGATYNEEIQATADYLNGQNKTFSFLHCVTKYPTPLAEIHLNRLNYLKKMTPSVGLSDHTLVRRDGIKAALAALFFGAEIIERHFTILPEDQTKDGPVSILPTHLKELSSFAKLSKEDQKTYIEENVPEFELMLGRMDRELEADELLNRDYYRGRFASHVNGEPVYNWEEKPIN